MLSRLGPAHANTRLALAHATLLFAATAWHLPGIGRPFGAADVNAGAYFGNFLRTFERFGFGALRGVPLAEQMKYEPAQGTPYFNHPPGLTWWMYSIGTSEAAMRVATLLPTMLAGASLLELLRGRCGLLVALLASLAFLLLPSNALLCQASYETAVLGCGLPLLLATERILQGAPRRRLWQGVQVAATFTGTWSDWSFLFFCVALLPVAAGRQGALRALLVPCVSGLAAVGSILLWQHWALLAPTWSGKRREQDVFALLKEHVGERAPLLDFLSGAWRSLSLANTWLVPIVASPGLLLLAWRDPRLLLALSCAGALHPLLFSKHAVDHFHFHGYLGPLFVAGLGARAHYQIPAARNFAATLCAGAALFAAFVSLDLRRKNETTLFRELGESLSALADDGAPDGGFLVASNFPHLYAYYTSSPAVVVPFIARPTWIEAGRTLPRYRGVRYLYTERGGLALPWETTSPELRSYLGQFPRTRVHEFDTHYWLPGADQPVRIVTAWVYEIGRD
jgi:hypothetical protein